MDLPLIGAVVGAIAFVVAGIVFYWWWTNRPAKRKGEAKALLDQQGGQDPTNAGAPALNEGAAVPIPTALSDRLDFTVAAQARGRHLKVRRILGEGAYGTVFLATNKDTGENVALKVVPCKDAAAAEDAFKECMLCARLQGHRNLIKLHDVFFDVPVVGSANGSPHTRPLLAGSPAVGVEPPQVTLRTLGIKSRGGSQQYLCIVTEYYEEGTLFDVLVRRGVGNGLPEALVWSYACQLLEALAYMHGQSIIHRDLKPSNVLIADQGERVVLTDFGLSRTIDAMEYAHTRTGTLQYMSPEQIQRRYNSKTDLWGVGCLIHSMCTCRVTMGDARMMFRERERSDFAAWMADDLGVGAGRYSAALLDFTLLLLSRSASSRPTAAQAAKAAGDMLAKTAEAPEPVASGVAVTTCGAVAPHPLK